MAREWLIEARNNATHEEVAQLVGIKRQYYSMIENGTRTPSVGVAKKIGAVLGFDWTIFFNELSNESFHKGNHSNVLPVTLMYTTRLIFLKLK